MKLTIMIGIAITLVILAGCENNTISESQVPTVEELEAIVKGNSLTLLEAVEAFAIDRGGWYPANSDSDTTATGKTLIDYLPGGERLINPFTGLKDQPVDSIPSSPGEIGYKRWSNGNTFFIQGFGANSIIVEHDNIEETEALVIENCLELQRAVEEWRSGDYFDYRYPCSSADCNQLGDVLQDCLPDRRLLENHFTGADSEPAIWGASARLPGEIGYECKVDQGLPVGYTITAVGFEPGVIIFQLSVN